MPMHGTPFSSWGLRLRMTRPAFLTLTMAACALGMGAAVAMGASLDGGVVLATVALACTAHAGANVLNDFYDARSGADDNNPGALYPFTGGAQLIQRGEVSEAATARWGWTLLGLTVVGGLALVLARRAWPVVGIGVAGLVLAWAYSAPPLKLMSRGLGEVAVGLSWGLAVMGAALMQMPPTEVNASTLTCLAIVGLGFGALTANVLLINGLPDAAGDARVGKRTVAVRWGGEAAARGYVALAISAYGLWWLGALTGRVPMGVLGTWLGLPFSVMASVHLLRHATRPSRLRPAIVCTIAATLVSGVAGGVGLAWMH